MTRLAALAVVLAGCYSPRVTPGVACTGACPGDQVCVDGFCRAPGIDAMPDARIDGSPDVDTDDDGVTDAADNCIAMANVDQHDEDGDDLGDLCDPCPHIAIGGGTDLDADGVGDACDPDPALPDQRWLVFDPFTSRAAAWKLPQGVTFAADAMIVDDGFVRYDRGFANVRIQLGGDLVSLAAGEHQMAIELSHADDTHYYYAEVYGAGVAGNVKLTRRSDGVFDSIDETPYETLPQGPFAWTFDISVEKQAIALSARHDAVQFPELTGPALPAQPIIASPFVQLGTNALRARIDYFAIIETL